MLWLNCLSKVLVRTWLKEHKMWSGKKIITSQRVRDSRAQSVVSRTKELRSISTWVVIRAVRGLGRHAADTWRSGDWKIEVVGNELQLWSSVGLIFLLILHLAVRIRIRTLTISIRFCLFRDFLPVCLHVFKRDGAKVGDRKTDEGRRISAPHMRRCIDNRAGIIGDNHSFSLSLPITLGRGLRKEDSGHVAPCRYAWPAICSHCDSQ